MSTVINEQPVDACVLGLGVVGGIVATELATKGYKVAGIEKGPYWDYLTDFALNKYDEWGVGMMHKWDHPLSLSSYSWRNNSTQFAIPFRRYNYPVGFTALGHGVGGGAQHYAADYGRYAPWTYAMYSSTVSKYGASFLSNIEPNLDLEDWPMTYDQWVPYYAEFEQAFAVTGTNQEPFIPNSTFPLPAHPDTPVGTMFQSAAESLGYKPFPAVTGIASKPYVNQYGVSINECIYDGWCAGLCNYQCETGAKANSANRVIPAAIKTGNFAMATNSYIFRLDMDPKTQNITAARYYDAEGNIHVQPATAFFVGLWGVNNTRLPLLSGVGQAYNPTTVTGTVGRGVNGGPIFNATASVSGTLNIGANAYPAGNAAGGSYSILDFADDNFDHTGLNFIGGAEISLGGYAGGGPNNLGIASGASPANIGSAYKAGVKDSYLPTTTGLGVSATQYPLPQTTQYMDLDPHYTDIYGDPLTRATLDGVDANGYNLNVHITPLLAPLLTKMGATNVTLNKAPSSLATAGHTVGFAGYHCKGGTRMGAKSSTSMINLYQQSWTSSNLFVTGETAGTSPDSITAGTHTIGPQAYVAAEGIVKYLKSPGELATST
ncbi:MAG: GMC family oxidoreductase N-terminal domain-containing protein [Thaumarchaeota archaeon]|nr:GMC family oxidoreductase N-terminal domain-containing protein [Nitrososphaerota archaeon]